MVDLAKIQERLAEHELVLEVDKVPKGHIRIETTFLYPDGSSVDVFLVDQKGIPLESQLLSDLGQTTSWLMDVQVKPWLSKKRQAFLEDAILLYGVTKEGGALQKNLDSMDSLEEGILALGQSCIRVADLAYTKRSVLQSVFADEVEEAIADIGLPYESNVDLVGRQSRKVLVDFLVSGRSKPTAVLTMSTGTRSTAHIQANEIFKRWYDLDIPERTENRVTIFDDRYDSYRDEDLERLRNFSDVIPFSDSSSLADITAA